jgi:15-cis-phytoene synthase
MIGRPTMLGRYDATAEASAAVVIGRYSTSFGAAARLLAGKAS